MIVEIFTLFKETHHIQQWSNQLVSELSVSQLVKWRCVRDTCTTCVYNSCCPASIGPDFNSFKYLWQDLKRTVHALSLCNLTELKQFHKEEWSKIPVSRCARLIEAEARLIDTYLYSAMIGAKGESTQH